MKIVLENIHKYYGSRAVVSRVNIFIDQGEIVGLL
ncbi:MAG: ABC transporter ATP-binding protein, partial [Trichodesmium sp. St19_bin2]|nr:ABC transporter ATP-binding protein [Trichodesmium sp. St19_bin2]